VAKGSFLPKPVPITVRIGELIPPPASTKKADLQAVTERCAAVINGLHDLGR
jgi:1-acyl-sn-glycerol-3-phosphate acyltransferase